MDKSEIKYLSKYDQIRIEILVENNENSTDRKFILINQKYQLRHYKPKTCHLKVMILNLK